MIMGQYKYGRRNQKLMTNLIFFGIPASWSLYLAVDYFQGDSSRGFFGLLPPEIRLYAFVSSLAIGIGIAYVGFRSMVKGSQIDGEIRLEAGRLRMNVRCGNRVEPVELEIRELTFVENDDERMRIASPGGEYIFNSSGFISGEVYQKFRMEMTCEKYKK